MRARTAYISSLGTTGILIASSLMLSLALGAFLSFDGWPTQADGHVQDVAVPAAAPALPSAALGRRVGAAHHRSASRAHARRGGARSARRRGRVVPVPGGGGSHGGRVVSALPAPAVGPRHLGDDSTEAAEGTKVATPTAHPVSTGGGRLALPAVAPALVPAVDRPPAADATLDDAHSRVVQAIASIDGR
jgi:hypothetical protein